MSEHNERPQRVEDQARPDQPIDIQLAEVLDRRHPALVRAIHILFQSPADILQNLIQNGNSKRGMIALEIIRQHRK